MEPDAPIPPPTASFEDVEHTPRQTRLPGAPRNERRILAIAAGVGVAFDVLAARRPPGIGLALSILLLMGAVVLLDGRSGLRLPSRARLGYAAVVSLFGLAACLRSSGDLLLVDGVAAYLAVVMLSVRVTGRRLLDMRVIELSYALVQVPAEAFIRVCEAFGRLIHPRGASEEAPDADRREGFFAHHGRDILVGFAIAIPTLALFGSLLAASDVGFSRLIGELFEWDVATLGRHVVTFAFATAAAAMVLVAALVGGPTVRQEEARGRWAGPAVVWIVLGSSATLFAAFLALQGAYLFGGPEYLDERSGLSAAQYAVHGFYELLAVAGIVVALLLAIRGGFSSRAASVRAFRVMAPTMAALTIVLLGSALARLAIYGDRYGLTEQRIYAAAVLCWIAAVLAWLARASDRGACCTWAPSPARPRLPWCSG